uniref:Ima1 N-terminal domain-containing protein n=1 Tax=Panagrolaimus sp. ES5 TaxID=591445 RepID=A0AC34G7S4_9BILA
MINTLIVGIFAVSALFYLYSVLRPKFKARVNCWFCNVNQWVPYHQKNAFMCKKCDQYNGFDKDGDYNKFIASQRIETLNMKKPSAKKSQFTPFPSTNGLCEMCNQKQSVIIERLKKFEAIDERQYFEEYERYKANLNQQYALCAKCQKYTEQKLQSVNEMYLPKSKPVKKATPSLFSKPFENSNAASPKSYAPSIISERAESIYSQRQRAPSVYSMASSRAPSTFSRQTRAPTLFSEPIRTPAFMRISSSKTPSIASGFSYKTKQTEYPPILHEEDDDEDSPKKSNHDHENRRRKFYFSSGWITVACHILTSLISTILFISLFDSCFDIDFLALEQYLPINIVNALHRCTKYAAFISALASGIFYYGFSESKTRINFLELLAFVSWPIFLSFCLFDVKHNPDFNLIKIIFAAYLSVLSTMILFIPKKRKHQKRPNNIYSAFSVASTPVSQCSSRLTASRIHNMSNLSNISQNSKSDSVPDLVEEWVRQTVPEADDCE